MRSRLGFLTVAVAAGAEIASTGCGGSMRVPGEDAGGKLDGASGSGGAAGAGGVSGVGGSRTDGGSRDASIDATEGAAIDVAVIDPEQFCEMWQTRASAQDTLDLQQLALFQAGTVLEGTLGSFVESGDSSYALFSVDRIRAGIRSYEGLATAIRIDRPLYDRLGEGTRVIAGFRQPHPWLDRNLALPIWDRPQALLAQSSTVAAELLAFHAWNTPNVAVVRVEELLDGGMTFALVESLRGDLPAGLVVSVSSYWPPLGAAVGSTWIGGFGEALKTTSGALPSATLLDLRPDTPEERAAVASALATLEPTGFAARYQAGLEQAEADAVRLRRGWIYNRADVVAALEVTGIGMECCTNAGGIFHASAVLEVLHGPTPAGQVLTGGHGYYGQKECGDRFLYAFASPVVLADGLGLDCQGQADAGEGPGSKVLHELPATADNLALARHWVSSAPPLLRLYPAGGEIPPEAFAPPAGIALWSTPVSPLTAVMAGTPVVLTVASATKHAEGYVVGVRTPFYTAELSHLEQREVEMAFACADPRLLQVGTRWIGSVVGTEVVHPNAVAGPLEQGHLWLVPGLLLPERSDLIRALGLLPTVVLD
ncbi:MAG: hypothetical protein JXP73_07825 [Deltaproteobacteria bacterium]|nr:hypothetical protein [Deltaproteobacteria bacterium]